MDLITTSPLVSALNLTNKLERLLLKSTLSLILYLTERVHSEWGPNMSFKYRTRARVTASKKHPSLLPIRVNYMQKKIYYFEQLRRVIIRALSLILRKRIKKYRCLFADHLTNNLRRKVKTYPNNS